MARFDPFRRPRRSMRLRPRARMPARSLDPASLCQDTGISLSFHDSHTGTLKRATHAGEPVRRDPLPAVRNPLIGFGLTTAAALILSFVISVPVLFFPDVALLLFYLPFALFGAGVLAGHDLPRFDRIHRRVDRRLH